MSLSKILRNASGSVRSVTPYDIKEMGSKGEPDRAEDARKEAETIIKEARSRKEAIEMHAYNEGMKKGEEEGKKMAIKKIEPLFDTFKNAMDELSSMKAAVIEEQQEQLLEIIFLIAEKIIHRSIQLSPDIVLDTVKEACKHLMESDDIQVRLHPSDFEYIREIEDVLGKKLSGKKEIQIIEDNTIDRGGVIIDTEFGEIDATIRSQIDHMKDILHEHN